MEIVRVVARDNVSLFQKTGDTREKRGRLQFTPEHNW